VFKRYEGAIEEFWRPPFGQADWSVLFARFKEELMLEPSEERQDRIAERIKLFRSILELADTEKKRGMRSVTTLDMKEMLKEDEHDFSIMCLGPSTDVIDIYNKQLAKNVIVKESHVETAHHNLASSVLAVKYGEWIGLLGADTERYSWNDILGRCGREWVSQARFVKVSHHGSPTGSYEKLWGSIESEHCDTVVTSFFSQDLPSYEGLRPIQEKGYPIYSTNRTFALQSCKQAQHSYRPTEMYLLPNLRADPSVGEVRLAVDETGRTEVSHSDNAGLIEVA